MIRNGHFQMGSPEYFSVHTRFSNSPDYDSPIFYTIGARCCRDGEPDPSVEPDPDSVIDYHAMVEVPGGPFMQGCNGDGESCSDKNSELPYHEVNVPAFAIDKYQITVAAYGECVTDPAATGCTVPYSGDVETSDRYNWGKDDRNNHPVNGITWDQAEAYCEWAGKRLCSESEWEKAARGTDGRIYPWGNEPATCSHAVMMQVPPHGPPSYGYFATRPVGSMWFFGVSPYGAYDMAGNVDEWVEDNYHSNYDEAPTDGSAWVDIPRDEDRVARGGGFTFETEDMRTSVRHVYDKNDTLYYVGARCCNSL